MNIREDIAALDQYRRPAQKSSAGEESLKKLSSGARINKASDSPENMAISAKMTASTNLSGATEKKYTAHTQPGVSHQKAGISDMAEAAKAFAAAKASLINDPKSAMLAQANLTPQGVLFLLR